MVGVVVWVGLWSGGRGMLQSGRGQEGRLGPVGVAMGWGYEDLWAELGAVVGGAGFRAVLRGLVGCVGVST